MKKSWKVPAILIGIIVIFNIAIFAAPFNRYAIFWISDIAVILAGVCQWLIWQMAMKKGGSLTSKVYGWPILSVGIRFFGILVICAFVFIGLSTWNPFFPIWVPVIVYILLFGAVGAGLTVTDEVRNTVERQDIQHQENVAFMRKLYSEASYLKKTAADKEINGILGKMAEAGRFSDPVSSPDVYGVEQDLYHIFEEVKNSAEAGDVDETKENYGKFMKELELRNSMCKGSKKPR